MATPASPTFPDNGSLRLYHMQPFRRYGVGKMGIDDMIDYVPVVAAMGFNAVWGGPFQATGTSQKQEGERTRSGSLYAMADDKAFNPVIFPECETTSQCEEKLRAWTAHLRMQGLFPVFDLVLNHVGCNAPYEGPTPIQRRLGEGLLLTERDKDWPDIQRLDYYRDGCRERGAKVATPDLDFEKINLIFERLWEPFIRRYILDYGFMGVRVDAITHIPTPVLQRANQLVESLVYKKFKTQAFILGELMVMSPESYVDALSTCHFTHMLHPCGFYWGHSREGGHARELKRSVFLRQNEELKAMVMAPPPVSLDDFNKLVIFDADIDPRSILEKATMYIFKSDGVTYLALNHHSMDFRFRKAFIVPIQEIADRKIQSLFEHCPPTPVGGRPDAATQSAHMRLLNALKKSPRLQEMLSHARPIQEDKGGLIGVVGNHDVGTLKAKCMLDEAYEIAIHRRDASLETCKSRYEGMKFVIKGIHNTDDLMRHLESTFELNPEEKAELYLKLNLRMREKIFFQAMMCLGGWYQLAGDEAGICHKPEVFKEYAEDSSRVGSPIREREASPQHAHPLKPFIAGINRILALLPKATYQTETCSYTLERDKTLPSDLFLVTRFDAGTGQYSLIGYMDKTVLPRILWSEIKKLLGPKHPLLCQENPMVHMIFADGDLRHIPREETVFTSIIVDEHVLGRSSSDGSTPVRPSPSKMGHHRRSFSGSDTPTQDSSENHPPSTRENQRRTPSRKEGPHFFGEEKKSEDSPTRVLQVKPGKKT